jgi:hypothetical protein
MIGANVSEVLAQTTHIARAVTGGARAPRYEQTAFRTAVETASLDLQAAGFEKFDAESLATEAWNRGNPEADMPRPKTLRDLRDATLRARARLGCIAMPSAGGRPVATQASKGSLFVGFLFEEPGKKTWCFDRQSGPLSLADAITYLDAMQ